MGGKSGSLTGAMGQAAFGARDQRHRFGRERAQAQAFVVRRLGDDGEVELAGHHPIGQGAAESLDHADIDVGSRSVYSGKTWGNTLFVTVGISPTVKAPAISRDQSRICCSALSTSPRIEIQCS